MLFSFIGCKENKKNLQDAVRPGEKDKVQLQVEEKLPGGVYNSVRVRSCEKNLQTGKLEGKANSASLECGV